ncbi:pentapeptide repeat-containing protein [Allokutzneria sp. NRRL B-24872]|uniref:pentapeptide repeat-containing protein n=1 Tax=Allokutzneria sp. NRRL B-24872 TaxID=1137961 RepID=UPI00143D9761|nr:pentapeptide repeat-containing protein [Allokutzneria sp. NRRL B-24872]
MVAVVVLLLGPVAWFVAGDTVRSLPGKERADAINAVRQSVLLGCGGAITAIGVAFAARTFALTRRGQVTDRFTKAITQLAGDTVQERLGGIYSLEHVMAESAPDHATVLEVLCAFVCERASAPRLEVGDYLKPPWQRATQPGMPEPRTQPDQDVQAVMTVLARRPVRAEPHRPKLIRTALAGVSIREMEFKDAPRLTRMFLTDSDLRRVDFRGADLTGTILNFADLRGAFLDRARLNTTHLHGADLRNASFAGSTLTGTNLQGANLNRASGLSAEQLSAALLDEDTVLPEPLREDTWIAARLADCAAWERSENRKSRFPPPTPMPRLTS